MNQKGQKQVQGLPVQGRLTWEKSIHTPTSAGCGIFATDFFLFMVSLVNSRSERSWLVVCACPVNAGKLSGLQCSFVGWLGSDAKSWMGHRDWTSYDDRWVPPELTRGPPHPMWPPWNDSVDTETLLFPPQICFTKLADGRHQLPDDPSDSVGASNLLETCKKRKRKSR